MHNRNGEKNILRRFGRYDFGIVILVLILCVIGLVVLYSAGYNHDTGVSIAMHRQMVSMILGLVLLFVVVFVDSDVWRRLALPFYLLGVVLLIAVFADNHVTYPRQE